MTKKLYSETSVHQANFVVNDKVFFFISFRQLLPPDIKCRNIICLIFTLDTTLERCAFCLIVTLDTDKARSDLIKPLGITFLLNELVI